MAKAPKKPAETKPAPISLNGKVPLCGRNRKPVAPRSKAAPYSAIPPRRTSNQSKRQREYLTAAELERVLKASAQVGRHGHRDRTMVLLAYRHGLRVSELVNVRWEQIDLKAGTLHVARIKNGVDSTHPIRGPELRALRELRRQYPDGPYLFVTERGGPLTPATFRKLFARAGELAALPFPIHPHMLRHATGYKLANEGHDTRALQQYLGHKNIRHTVRYTELSPERFKKFWKD